MVSVFVIETVTSDDALLSYTRYNGDFNGAIRVAKVSLHTLVAESELPCISIIRDMSSDEISVVIPGSNDYSVEYDAITIEEYRQRDRTRILYRFFAKAVCVHWRIMYGDNVRDEFGAFATAEDAMEVAKKFHSRFESAIVELSVCKLRENSQCWIECLETIKYDEFF